MLRLLLELNQLVENLLLATQYNNGTHVGCPGAWGIPRNAKPHDNTLEFSLFTMLYRPVATRITKKNQISLRKKKTFKKCFFLRILWGSLLLGQNNVIRNSLDLMHTVITFNQEDNPTKTM